MTVTILNSSKQVVTTKKPTAAYSSANGDFTATVDLGSSWKAGNYYVTIAISSISHSLTQMLGQYSGSLYAIAPGKKTDLPRTPLFLGDINGDGVVNILDYNILLDCFHQTGCSKPSSQYTASDMSDNGKVDMVDYNIFLRSEIGINANCTGSLCVYNMVWPNN